MKDKLQKYALSKVGKDNVIWSKSTNSAYFNFQGTALRISDHLPSSGSVNQSGATLSIIITSNPDQYILQQHSTGRLSVLTYNRAKEIIRSMVSISDVFRYPKCPFQLEKEFVDTLVTGDNILGEPLKSFTQAQLNQINSLVKNAKNRRHLKEMELRKQERTNEHLKTPSK